MSDQVIGVIAVAVMGAMFWAWLHPKLGWETTTTQKVVEKTEVFSCTLQGDCPIFSLEQLPKGTFTFKSMSSFQSDDDIIYIFQLENYGTPIAAWTKSTTEMYKLKNAGRKEFVVLNGEIGFMK
mgnify:FL=1